MLVLEDGVKQLSEEEDGSGGKVFRDEAWHIVYASGLFWVYFLMCFMTMEGEMGIGLALEGMEVLSRVER